MSENKVLSCNSFRGHKRHIRENHINFLKPPRTAGCLRGNLIIPKGADSHPAREPVYKPHVGPRFSSWISLLSHQSGRYVNRHLFRDDEVGPLSIYLPKGLADGGGWREEILPMPQIKASFLHLFHFLLMTRRTQFWGPFFAVFWALLVANPLPPTPFLGNEKGT